MSVIVDNSSINFLEYFGDLVILWLFWNSCHQNTKYHKNNMLQINSKTL